MPSLNDNTTNNSLRTSIGHIFVLAFWYDFLHKVRGRFDIFRRNFLELANSLKKATIF